MRYDRPKSDEFHPFYASYVEAIDEDAAILPVLADQPARLRALVAGLRSESAAAFRYAPGKWSVLEVVGHMADAERIFGTRATCIARGESVDLPGYEQDDYVATAGFDDRTMESLLREFEFLREANLEMLGGLPAGAWGRVGSANGSSISVRALAWIMAGHVEHHIGVLPVLYADAFAT